MSHRRLSKLLHFTAAGRVSENPEEEIETGGDSRMGGTETDVDPLSAMGGPTIQRITWEEKRTDPEHRSTGWRSPYPRNTESRRRSRSPQPTETNITEDYFQNMMNSVMEGIRYQTQWIGTEKERVGLAVEQLSDEQQRVWQEVQKINKTGNVTRGHVQQYGEQLETLLMQLEDHERNRDEGIRKEQEQQRQQLLETIEQQKRQHAESQAIIEELRKTQGVWQTYTDNALPQQIRATISAMTADALTPDDVDKRIRQLLKENLPQRAPTNVFTREQADQLVKEALGKQAAAQQQQTQEEVQRAVREATASRLTREEVQEMIRQQRRRSFRNPTPGAGGQPPHGQTPHGDPIYVNVTVPERAHHRAVVEPWQYSGNPSDDLRAWLLACEDFFNWNGHEWVNQVDCIKFAITRLKHGTRAHEFGISYRRSMDGTDGYPLIIMNREWIKFKTEILKRFEPEEGALIAKQEMDNLRYDGDIASYIDKIRSLNYRVKMSGVTLRSTINSAISEEIRIQSLYQPQTDNDDEWMRIIIAIGQTVELGKRQEKLIKQERGGTRRESRTSNTQSRKTAESAGDGKCRATKKSDLPD